MSTYTTTAEAIIDTVIQDGQIQTTNRPALLGFVNRVSMRMLRESQWLFLRSQEQRFITQPDASSYWLGTGAPPAGCVDTGLDLSDLYAVIPDSVYDLSNARQLAQDSEQVLKGANLRFKDASFRASLPRTYNFDFNLPNVLNLYPPPDNNNTYQPVPNSPVCNWIVGGALPTSRNYYIKVTLVDSNGGESGPSVTYSNIVVPSGHLLTVDPATMDVASANTVQYAFYNVYVAFQPTGNYYLQNPAPISRAVRWIEPTVGIGNVQAPPQSINVSTPSLLNWTLGVNTIGQLVTTLQSSTGSVPPVYLEDSTHVVWEIDITDSGQLNISPGFSSNVVNLILADIDSQNWIVGVTTSGQLTTTPTGTIEPSTVQPPVSPTIAEMYGYVISFYYQKQRTPITDTSDILQIPDQYFDVIIAGVNYYANMYTSKDQDVNVKAGIWKKEFMDGLAQMRRDLRINFRNTDFISPDPASKRNQGIDWNIILYN